MATRAKKIKVIDVDKSNEAQLAKYKYDEADGIEFTGTSNRYHWHYDPCDSDPEIECLGSSSAKVTPRSVRAKRTNAPLSRISRKPTTFRAKADSSTLRARPGPSISSPGFQVPQSNIISRSSSKSSITPTKFNSFLTPLTSNTNKRISASVQPQPSTSKVTKRESSPGIVLISSSPHPPKSMSPQPRAPQERKAHMKLKRSFTEVIDISSDEDDHIGPSQKKMRKISPTPDKFFSLHKLPEDNPTAPNLYRAEPELSDDDDWEPPGFELTDPERWTPIQFREKFMLDLPDDTEADWQPRITEKRDSHPSSRHVINTSLTYPQRSWRCSRSPEFVWDELRMVDNLNFQPRPRPHGILIPNRPYVRPWNLDFDLYNLKPEHSFKKSPGSINTIAQQGLWTIIGSACPGGVADYPDEVVDVWNGPGSLISWRSRVDVLDGHQLRRGTQTKYYGVSDVKFHPSSPLFISSGADLRVWLWALNEEGLDSDVFENCPPWRKLGIVGNHLTEPHDLAFKPNSSILAVASRQVKFFEISEDSVQKHGSFDLHHNKARYNIGSILWGAESTSGCLFASSEPISNVIYLGRHAAYDLQSKTILYHLEAAEAGDSLALHPSGSSLALSTRAGVNKHMLRLYDVGRQDGKATTTINLQHFPVRCDNFEGEVNCAMFSPDGIYLALARNDNHIHVYDSRMLERGPLFNYNHFGDSKATSAKYIYGVAKMQWLQSSSTGRMGLVSGGEDGCIRLWDPRKSDKNEENGKSVAEANSDVGYFSLGDPYAGEHQLIVGDCSGEVTMFNNIVL